MPSDPARLSSTQASFRLRLGAPVAPLIEAPAGLLSTGAAFGDPYASQGLIRRSLVTPQVVVPASAVPAFAGAGGAGAPRRKGRVTAVTWTGQAPPGTWRPPGCWRPSGSPACPPRRGRRARRLPGRCGHPGDPLVRGCPDRPQAVARGRRDGHRGRRRPGRRTPGLDAQRRAARGLRRLRRGRPPWYPGRRVDLGLVLLPLRAVLGSLSVYAGFSKLCDPVYFDGGERGSMMRWLSSLHPWRVAEPLLAFAMAHPVGAGLVVSFTEIVVGVLTVLGLWQRIAAGAAMLLSAALLFTVSWRAVPVYDTPDLIFLAAWSPLLIAGAPFASLDGRLNLEAWRRYGSGAPAALRRRVLRRGAVVTAVVVGLTLLLGSMLGAAVRTGSRPHPRRPSRPPTTARRSGRAAVRRSPPAGRARPPRPRTHPRGRPRPRRARPPLPRRPRPRRRRRRRPRRGPRAARRVRPSRRAAPVRPRRGAVGGRTGRGLVARAAQHAGGRGGDGAEAEPEQRLRGRFGLGLGAVGRGAGQRAAVRALRRRRARLAAGGADVHLTYGGGRAGARTGLPVRACPGRRL
ncbi:DoxX family membrane protein [Kitasatospora aburaviensis]